MTNTHATTTPLLLATDVHKTYRLDKVDVPVLRGASVRVDPGEWVAILGASGSGKSTLLHLLGGLDRPDRKMGGDGRAGDVMFDGTSLRSMSARELDRYRSVSVGFIFQFYHLLPELTVLDNVLIAAMIRDGRIAYRRGKADITRRARTLLETFGLSHRLSHRPKELSGGERQRVAIARALLNDPRVLLADEPTGNLDRRSGQAILDTLAAYRQTTGLAIVMVTHDINVASLANRIVRLEDGRIAAGQGSEGGSYQNRGTQEPLVRLADPPAT